MDGRVGLFISALGEETSKSRGCSTHQATSPLCLPALTPQQSRDLDAVGGAVSVPHCHAHPAETEGQAEVAEAWRLLRCQRPTFCVEGCIVSPLSSLSSTSLMSAALLLSNAFFTGDGELKVPDFFAGVKDGRTWAVRLVLLPTAPALEEGEERDEGRERGGQ